VERVKSSEGKTVMKERKGTEVKKRDWNAKGKTGQIPFTLRGQTCACHVRKEVRLRVPEVA